jgi:glycosyltransferase involved in cell wall biosynthesis
MKTILFYSTTHQFGGHEMMSLKYIEALCERAEYKIYVAIFEGNNELRGRLDKLQSTYPSVEVVQTKFKTKSFQGLRNFINWSDVVEHIRLLRRISPDRVIALQGSIESSSGILLPSILVKMPVTSYIPNCNGYQESGAKLGRLRDMVNKSITYKLLHSIITISDGQKSIFSERWKVKCPIYTVPNYVSTERFHGTFKPNANTLKIGLVGRLDFRHKRQDLFLSFVDEQFRDDDGFEFILAGNGSDRDKELIRKGICNLSNVTYIEWLDNPQDLYRELDAIVLFSRYEGVPLVMIEAILSGIPVFSTRVYGMKEYLPEDWTVELGKEEDLASKIRMLKTNPHVFEKPVIELQRKFIKMFDQAMCRSEFISAVGKI